MKPKNQAKVVKAICLTVFGLIASLQFVSAQTAVLYQEDWGTTNGGTNMAAIGWEVLPVGYYNGFFADTNAVDDTTAASLPAGSWYFGGSGTAMFYTINGGGRGTGGDSAFTSIDPTLYTNLEFSLYSVYNFSGKLVQMWFAVQVGGDWYVSTNHPIMPDTVYLGSAYHRTDMTYSPVATNWNTLAVGANVVISGHAGVNLSGPITGIGLVTDPNGGYLNVNEFLITSISNTPAAQPPTLVAAPLSQTVYAGGGVSFSVAASPLQPYSYYWQTNGVTLVNGGRISGANSATLTILDITAADAGSYSVIVSNSAGSFNTSTNSTASLTVNPVPADCLYAETFPFVGPSTSLAYSLGTVGWSGSVPDNTNRLFYDGVHHRGAIRASENYSQTYPLADFFYATTNSDAGTSGVPFRAISTTANPVIAFSVDVDPTASFYNGAGNSTAYFAVQMNGGSWYVSTIPIPVNTNTTGSFSTYQQQFYSAATVWNNLTLTGTGATIGSQAAANLTGQITGAGVVVVETAASELDFENFLITTDSGPVNAPTIDYPPKSQTVYTGGGASFEVHVKSSGTPPYYYYWQSNGVTIASSFSGAGSNVFAITDAGTNDAGDYSCIVSNAAGMDNSASHATATLTVNPTAAGLLYAETFPTYEVPPGFYPIGSVGWLVANTLGVYSGAGGTSPAYFYSGGAGMDEFYVTTASDTGVSGLPFPSIALASNPNLTLSATIQVTTNATTANFIVQMNSTSWFISAASLPLVYTGSTNYTQAFAPGAANWNTFNISTMSVGGAAGSNLTGSLTGAGVFFDYPDGENGSISFFSITSPTNFGSITAVASGGNSLTLNWTAESNVGLQSATNLAAPVVWTDVPGTMGQGSAIITTTNAQMYFRVAQP